MSASNVLIEKKSGYAVVTLNRPDKLNALNRATIDELGTTMGKLTAQPEIRCVIITGAGEKAFVAGADITEITALDRQTGKEFARNGQKVFRQIETMPIPVIAAINGFALGGGCELAMACHIRLATENARFGQPEVNLGIIPGYGGTQRLARLIGLSRALHWCISGDLFDAQTALDLGLVNEVVPLRKLMERAAELAGIYAQKAPLAVRHILAAMYEGADKDLDEALRIEAAHFGHACASEDMEEGTRAFIEKRKPKFQGK